MGRLGWQWIGGLALGAAVLALTLVVAIGAAAVDGASGERPAGKRAALKAFKSCDRLRAHYRRHPQALSERIGPVFEDLAMAGGPG